MFNKENAVRGIVHVAQTSSLSNRAKGECIASLFVKTPKEFHCYVVLKLFECLREYWNFSTSEDCVKVNYLVSVEDALFVETSDQAKRFLKEILAALWEDFLEGAKDVILLHIHDENSSFAFRAFIFEYVVTDFRKFVTSCQQ